MLLKRMVNKAMAPFRLLYWRMAEPRAEGVKILIECDGKYLMIKNTYGPKHWTLPGGGKKGDETPLEAAKREVQEEVGISIDNFKSLGSYFHTRQYKQDTISCFYAQVSTPQYRVDHEEVGEAAWFTKEEVLSLARSKSVDDVLALLDTSSRGA